MLENKRKTEVEVCVCVCVGVRKEKEGLGPSCSCKFNRVSSSPSAQQLSSIIWHPQSPVKYIQKPSESWNLGTCDNGSWKMSAIRNTVVCVHSFPSSFPTFSKATPHKKVLNNLALLCQGGGEINYDGNIIIIFIINPKLRTFFAKRSVSLL